MLGGIKGGEDISKYLINFNASNWANQANTMLQNALQQGLNYSQNYSKEAIKQVQNYDQRANQAMTQGYRMAQALDTPQHLATYNALDAYSDSLGLARPKQGSFQVAKQLSNQVAQQPMAPQGLLQGQPAGAPQMGHQMGYPQPLLGDYNVT